MSRQLETRLKVVDALGERVQSLPMEKVRVVDVCHIAGISRTTFYEYFEDLDAVGEWLWDHLMERTLYQAGRQFCCYEAHLRKFESLLEYREFFMGIFRLTNYRSVTQHGGREMYARIAEVAQEKSGRQLSPDEAARLEFFITGAKHMTRHWVEGGMVESPAFMAGVFDDAMPACIKCYLDADPAYVRPPID